MHEHKPEPFEIPPGKTERYTSSLKAALGIDESDVRIILIEPPMENWGVLGKPASDIDVGFKIDV